jgi:bifunctional DNA-binding transcriptional regulator/antitoxin component of YhaV-PrlF toxin-antitoxin module
MLGSQLGSGVEMVSRLDEEWQITIDKAVREHLGLTPGMIAYQRVIGERLEIVFLTALHRRSLSGPGPRDPVSCPVFTREDIEETVMEAIAGELARSAEEDPC